MRLIDADALEEVVYDDLHYRAEIENEDFDLVINYLEAAPTIDPESLRPLGVWVGEADGYADGELVYDVWYCSDCNYCIDDGTDDPHIIAELLPQLRRFYERSGRKCVKT